MTVQSSEIPSQSPTGDAVSLAPSRSLAIFILIFGVFACSISVIFLKHSTTHPFWLSGIRVLIAAAALSPLYAREVRKAGGLSRGAAWGVVPGAALLAAHFIAWTWGSRQTTAVNGSLLVNLAPAVMPLTMWMICGERVNRGEILGTGVSMIGVVMLIGAGYTYEPKNLPGDVVCFVAMVLFCFYIALGRRYGMAKNLWLYVVPLYAITGVLCLAVAALLGTPFVDPTRPPVSLAQNVVMLICLGLIPTVIGHSSLNWCIKHMRGQIVSTVNLAQFIFAGVLAYFFLNGELPDKWFYPASVLIVFGSVLVIRAHRTQDVATVDPET